MNDVMLLVLVSVADGPKHGYAIQEDIAAAAGTRLGPGSLYGAIGRLERDGLIRPLDAGGRRKPYEITPEGTRVLRERIEGLRSLVEQADARLATS